MTADESQRFARSRPSEAPGANRPLVGAVALCASSLLGTAAGPVTAAALAENPSDDPGSGELKEVTVTGVRSFLHDKLSQDQQDTPQSVTVVSDRLMTEQATTRLEDALKNVPGITLNAGEGAARGDTVNLRGFSAFNDFFLDGIRDAAVYTRDSFDLDSLEVLKGPSAVLFGRGSTGGAINQVTKAPLLRPFDAVTTQFGSNDLFRATADLDAPLGVAAAARLNLMGESSAVASRDEVRNRRWGVAPALGLGIGEHDSLTLAYLHQQEDDIPDTGIPFVFGRPAPVPRDSFYGLSSDRTTTDDDIATARYVHEFNDGLVLADTLRYAHYEFDYLFDAPNFGSTPPTIGQPLSSVLVGRDAPSSSGIQTNLTEQLDLTARFQTGFLSHTLVTGFEIARQSSDLQRFLNPFNRNNNWVPPTPLLAPDPYQTHAVEPVSSTQDTTAPSGGAYLIDTIGFGKYVSLVAGMRYDYFSADYHQFTVASGAVLNLHELNRVGSPRASLILKPTARQTYYLSYGTSFDPSAEALTLTTKTAALGPVKAKSYEAGAKSEWLDGRLSISGALFHTEVDNAQTNDPDNPNITVLNGNERVNGLEFGANGHLTRQWAISAGYTYLDGRTLASGTPAYVGKEMPNVAHDALNLWTEYEFPGAWEIGAGGNWLGHRYADGGQMANVPGYVVWNAMVSHALSRNLTVQLNGLNLFDRLYYDGVYYTSPSENHAIPGPGRTVMMSIRMNF
jgi:catecholate siderophore receptor